METISADVAIIGSGFAGSLAALILHRLDLRAVVVDKARHPRFAIGESSTPIANQVLFDLAERYDLTRLAPLTKYGPWLRHYPQVGCGLKRGFSYFQHRAGESYVPRADHANELLVAASADDEQGDTQWLRADVDQFFANELRRAEIPLLEGTELTEVALQDAVGPSAPWTLRGRTDGTPVEIRAAFVIDASGEGTVLPRALGIRQQSDVLLTNSRALYAHFTGVGSWQAWLQDHGAALADYPFSCDDAAQHQVLDDAWMWVLRFRNGVTSVGIAADAVRWPLDSARSPDEEWAGWLQRYPSVGELLSAAQVADPPGKLLRTGRLQRCVQQVAGPTWALLPHTAGFIDPLHSTGIAHTLCGVERLMKILEAHWGRDSLTDRLRQYEQIVFSELTLIDQIVAACYATLGQFPLLVATSMLYFAAATTYEQRRAATGYEPTMQYLLAGDEKFRQAVRRVLDELSDLLGVSLTDPRRGTGAAPARRVDASRIARFEQLVREVLEPFNEVGLCDPSARNMYRYTAAP